MTVFPSDLLDPNSLWNINCFPSMESSLQENYEPSEIKRLHAFF